MELQLPIPVQPVLVGPHWRITFRPEQYDRERVPSIQKCWELIDQTKLSIRGWDYPHVSRRDSEREIGNNWIASWSDYGYRNEYWRFFQSGQFIHLFSVEETTNPEWLSRSRALAKSHLGFGALKDFDWNQVPGFFSVLNFLYTVTEVFEFAARLCAKKAYEDTLTISIGLKNIQGFVLTHEWDRAWHNKYASSQENLSNEWEISPPDLIAQSTQRSLEATKWFFERFGWFSKSDQVLKNDQENFLTRRF